MLLTQIKLKVCERKKVAVNQTKIRSTKTKISKVMDRFFVLLCHWIVGDFILVQNDDQPKNAENRSFRQRGS